MIEDYSQALTVLPGLDTALGSFLQDSIMYLCISDSNFLKVTRNLFPLEFAPGTVYRKMLSLWFDYYDKFKTCPIGQEETELKWALNSRQLTEQEFSQAVDYLSKLSGMEPPNPDYVLDRLGEFSLQRKWFVSGVEFTKLIRSGKLEEGRALITSALREGIGSILDSGVDLFSDDRVSDRVIRRNLTRPYLMKWMIDVFDRIGITMNVGNYILIAAPEKRGKTWAGIHLAKAALLQGLNVLHCSQGDLTEDELEDRYDQCFTSSFHWRREGSDRYKIHFFNGGDGSKLKTARVPVGSIKDMDVVKTGVSSMKSFGGKLVLKGWPMNVCTMRMFDSFLDHLAVNENFFPNLIINDYGEIMRLISNDRDGIDEMNKEHRRMAGERRALVVNFSQVTQKAYTKKWISLGDFAEDKRKAAHVDGAYALCQTPEERKRGTARFVLFVDRHFGLQGFCAEITQDYSIGQFCTSSRRLPKIEDKEKGD